MRFWKDESGAVATEYVIYTPTQSQDKNYRFLRWSVGMALRESFQLQEPHCRMRFIIIIFMSVVSNLVLSSQNILVKFVLGFRPRTC